MRAIMIAVTTIKEAFDEEAGGSNQVVPHDLEGREMMLEAAFQEMRKQRLLRPTAILAVGPPVPMSSVKKKKAKPLKVVYTSAAPPFSSDARRISVDVQPAAADSALVRLSG
jgi:hypothetical protein